jgi:hypothetical protein
VVRKRTTEKKKPKPAGRERRDEGRAESADVARIRPGASWVRFCKYSFFTNSFRNLAQTAPLDPNGRLDSLRPPVLDMGDSPGFASSSCRIASLCSISTHTLGIIRSRHRVHAERPAVRSARFVAGAYFRFRFSLWVVCPLTDYCSIDSCAKGRCWT